MSNNKKKQVWIFMAVLCCSIVFCVFGMLHTGYGSWSWQDVWEEKWLIITGSLVGASFVTYTAIDDENRDSQNSDDNQNH